MADSEKLKPRAMRLTDETADKFREITKELGDVNQQQTLARLIEVYELEKGKERFPEMRETIDTFEGYIFSIRNMFMHHLGVIQDVKQIARTEFQVELKSKDRLIAELQNRVDIAEKVASEAIHNETSYKETISLLEKENTDLQTQMEKERDVFTRNLASAEQKLDSLRTDYRELQKSDNHTKELLTSLMADNELLRQSNASLSNELSVTKDQLVKSCSTIDVLQQSLEKEQEQSSAKLDRITEQMNWKLEQQSLQFEQRLLQLQLENQQKENEYQRNINNIRMEYEKLIKDLNSELDRYRGMNVGEIEE